MIKQYTTVMFHYFVGNRVTRNDQTFYTVTIFREERMRSYKAKLWQAKYINECLNRHMNQLGEKRINNE